MKIYKTTKRKHVLDALSKGKIRIGTLSQYKRTEKEEIGDRGEGLKAYELKNDSDNNILLDSQEANRLLERSGFTLNKDWKININSGGGLLFQNSFNTPIFCTSITDNEVKELNGSFGDDLYFITKPDLFAHMVGFALGQKIRGKLSKHKDVILPERYFFHHSVVDYSQKTLTTADSSEIPNFDKTINLLEIFQKDDFFSHQKEYRFAWFFATENNGKLDFISLPPNIEFFDVKIPNLRQTIKSAAPNKGYTQ
jgi:hypothetical protein